MIIPTQIRNASSYNLQLYRIRFTWIFIQRKQMLGSKYFPHSAYNITSNLTRKNKTCISNRNTSFAKPHILNTKRAHWHFTNSKQPPRAHTHPFARPTFNEIMPYISVFFNALSEEQTSSLNRLRAARRSFLLLPAIWAWFIVAEDSSFNCGRVFATSTRRRIVSTPSPRENF